MKKGKCARGLRAGLVVLVGVLLWAPSPASAQEATANLRIVHGVLGLAADVLVDGESVVAGLQFGDVQNLTVPAGDHQVSIMAGGEEIASLDVTTVEGGDYSLAAITFEEGASLRLTEEQTTDVPAGQAGIVVRHYAEAVGVATIVANGAVFVDDFELFEDVSANVPAGPLSVAVQSPDGAITLFGPAELELEAGNRYLVFAVGDPASDFALAIDVLAVGAAAPAAVASGTGGQAAQARVPGWVWLASVLAAGIAVGGGVTLRRSAL